MSHRIFQLERSLCGFIQVVGVFRLRGGCRLWLHHVRCYEAADGFLCSSAFNSVPNDYHNASAGTTKIALARYKATKEPRQGIILLNPGGPGGPGTMLAGKFMQPLLGEDYDLVGFDPRGIGRTEYVLI